jgi:methyl-accepting chemotaxis protein
MIDVLSTSITASFSACGDIKSVEIANLSIEVLRGYRTEDLTLPDPDSNQRELRNVGPISPNQQERPVMLDMISSPRIRELEGVTEALGKSQAVIHFAMDGTIQWANENFLAAMGYSLAEIQGKHHRMFVESAYADSGDYRQFWDKLNRGEYQAALFKRVGKGGREVWIQASYNPIAGRGGKPVKVIKFATDVTEQVLQNADFKGQIDALGRSQAVIHFKLDGTILWANDNFLAALGYALDEIKGKHHSMFVDSAYRASSEYARFWQRLNTGEFQTAEYKRVGKGGKEVWIQASYNPIFDPSGKPFKVVKYATDITKQMHKRMESERIGALVEQNLEKIVSSVGQVNQQSASAATASSETLSTVQTVASAAEELSASVKEIAQTMTASKSAVDEAIGQTVAADRSTIQLSKNAESMNGIVVLIQKIAGQINLLALNATIESARAGEAGKGFAVVANEVKNLANQVAKATDDISNEIVGMQTVSGEVVKALGEIKASVQAVQKNVIGAAGAVEEQTVVTREISSNMQTASGAVASIDESLSEIVKSLETANHLAKDGKDMYGKLRRDAA